MSDNLSTFEEEKILGDLGSKGTDLVAMSALLDNVTKAPTMTDEQLMKWRPSSTPPTSDVPPKPIMVDTNTPHDMPLQKSNTTQSYVPKTDVSITDKTSMSPRPQTSFMAKPPQPMVMTKQTEVSISQSPPTKSSNVPQKKIGIASAPISYTNPPASELLGTLDTTQSKLAYARDKLVKKQKSNVMWKQTTQVPKTNQLGQIVTNEQILLDLPDIASSAIADKTTSEGSQEEAPSETGKLGAATSPSGDSTRHHSTENTTAHQSSLLVDSEESEGETSDEDPSLSSTKVVAATGLDKTLIKTNIPTKHKQLVIPDLNVAGLIASLEKNVKEEISNWEGRFDTLSTQLEDLIEQSERLAAESTTNTTQIETLTDGLRQTRGLVDAVTQSCIENFGKMDKFHSEQSEMIRHLFRKSDDQDKVIADLSDMLFSLVSGEEIKERPPYITPSPLSYYDLYPSHDPRAHVEEQSPKPMTTSQGLTKKEKAEVMSIGAYGQTSTSPSPSSLKQTEKISTVDEFVKKMASLGVGVKKSDYEHLSLANLNKIYNQRVTLVQQLKKQ